jgi:hypothetical protein
MRKVVVILFLSLFIGCHENYHPEIKPYVDYLEKNDIKSAKDYILGLFNDHDIVIVCERDHWEITQYDLFIEIVEDPYFINEVGNIFTEVGTVSLQDEVNDFVNRDYETDSLKNADARAINRNLSFDPLWNRYNFYYFIQELNEINSKITIDKKINLFPVDVPFPGWKEIRNAEQYKDWEKTVLYKNRDSIIARNIIDKISDIQNKIGKQPKSLIIMNHAHAYSRDMAYTYFKNPDSTNVGRYLFDQYPDKVANVFINTLVKNYPPDTTKTYKENDGYFPINDGKWDAAFLILKRQDAGFNLLNTPFGQDYFDHFQYSNHSYSYQDIFTGMIYFKRPEDFIDVAGIPNIMDDDFDNEYIRRLKILYDARKIDYDSLKLANRLKEKYSVDTFQFEEYKNSQKIINKWLK